MFGLLSTIKGCRLAVFEFKIIHTRNVAGSNSLWVDKDLFNWRWGRGGVFV